jgi:hypothetical protein
MTSRTLRRASRCRGTGQPRRAVNAALPYGCAVPCSRCCQCPGITAAGMLSVSGHAHLHAYAWLFRRGAQQVVSEDTPVRQAAAAMPCRRRQAPRAGVCDVGTAWPRRRGAVPGACGGPERGPGRGGGEAAGGFFCGARHAARQRRPRGAPAQGGPARRAPQAGAQRLLLGRPLGRLAQPVRASEEGG